MTDDSDQHYPKPGSGGQSDRSVAIALRQDGARGSAPRVIAKGHGAVAEQILALAFDHDVKVRTDADLAEILSAIEIESEVPLQALAAVAEILTYIYRVTNTPTAETAP